MCGNFLLSTLQYPCYFFCSPASVAGRSLVTSDLNHNLAVIVNDLTKTGNFQQTSQKLTAALFIVSQIMTKQKKAHNIVETVT